jgi:hypothetical protein
MEPFSIKRDASIGAFAFTPPGQNVHTSFFLQP